MITEGRMGIWAQRYVSVRHRHEYYSCSLYTYTTTCIPLKGSHMILLTDPNKPSYESFCYAMPQGKEAWEVWVAAAARFNSYVMGIAKAYRVDANDKVDLIVLLPTEDQSDDEVETAAAHLRVNERYEGKIFVLRAEAAKPEREMRLAALAGGYTDIEEFDNAMDIGDPDA